MPKRGEKGLKANQTEKYRQMFANDPNAKNLCKSQIYSASYCKLQRDRRLDRFIALVQYCSMSGLNIQGACEVIKKAFPGYIRNNELTVEIFEEMIKNYKDISIAWGYGKIGDDIANIIVKNKALGLVQKTDSMEDVKLWNDMYGNNKNVSADNVDKVTSVGFYINRK